MEFVFVDQNNHFLMGNLVQLVLFLVFMILRNKNVYHVLQDIIIMVYLVYQPIVQLLLLLIFIIIVVYVHGINQSLLIIHVIHVMMEQYIITILENVKPVQLILLLVQIQQSVYAILFIKLFLFLLVDVNAQLIHLF